MKEIFTFNKLGKRHGYWDVCTIRSRYKGVYDNGKTIGYWREYKLNGELTYRAFIII